MRSGNRRYFTETFKRQIIDYYLMHGGTKKEVWNKYTGEEVERGRILRWMRQLGYVKAEVKRVSYLKVMSRETDQKSSALKGKLYENELIKELRRQLEEEKLKVFS